MLLESPVSLHPMLRNSFTWLLLFIVSTALAACCGSVTCTCQDSLDDALFFRFVVDTSATPSNGFRPEELQTVFIVRVPLDTAQRPRADTVALTAGRSGLVQTVIINNANPFAQNGTRKLDQYRYEIYLGTRQVPTKSFQITNVAVEDEFISDACCTCNNNVQKDLTIDGQPRSLADPGGEDKAEEVVLTR